MLKLLRNQPLFAGFTLLSLLLAISPASLAKEIKDPALNKIMTDFENTYGPMHMFWSDRNQLRLCLALINEAQKDSRITPAEGKFIEDLKLELSPLSDSAEVLFEAQHSWLGKACGSNSISCTPARTYTVKEKYISTRKP